MIYLSCFLVAMGLADLVRARSSKAWVAVAGGVLGVAALASLLFVTGASLLAIPIGVALLTAWMLATSLGSLTIRKITIVSLALLAAACLAIVPAVPGGSPAQQWYEQLSYPVLDAVPFNRALATVAVVLFLLESANVVVRTMLSLPESSHARPRGGLGARRRTDTLRGGRIIGPLERIFLFTLALAGQFTAIGAIVAAKGIVRFPELTKDTSRGANAEMFLVGSFSSWALVLLAVLYTALS